MSRDRIENALRRVHSDTLANTTIEVFEPTESFSQGDGYSVSWSDTADATYDARVESPSTDAERERSGTTAEVDRVVKIRDDTGQTWTGFGDATEAPVRIEDTADGTRYEVQTVEDTHNGLTKLGVVEL